MRFQALSLAVVWHDFLVHAGARAAPADHPGKALPLGEMAERWGVSVETIARVEDLGRQVDTSYQGWAKSRDRSGIHMKVTAEAQCCSASSVNP
jgi:hypothetical protein